MSQVKKPSHYTAFPIEVKDIIRLVLNETKDLTPYQVYCFGNELKYRLRAGLKDDIKQDIGKAMEYMNFRNKNKESENGKSNN